MKAVVYTEYGSPDVLKFTEVAKPTPKANEILIRIHATPINIGDIWARNFKAVSLGKFSMPAPIWLPARIAMGFNKPRRHILGSEFAGDIAAVGKDVTLFKVGDPVFGYRAMNFGANAEYLCMPESGLVALKPTNMTYEEAASIPYGAITALNLLRKVNIQPGQKVLINGASGSIGSHALQLAKYYGAEVTGVCSTKNLELVKSLGADKVIDYTQEDFTKNGQTYDLIFDTVGKSSFSRCKGSLTPNGRYLTTVGRLSDLLQMLWTRLRGGRRVIFAVSIEKKEELRFIKELMETEQLRPVIDKRYPMEQIVEAHRYVEAGHKKGNVVITVTNV